MLSHFWGTQHHSPPSVVHRSVVSHFYSFTDKDTKGFAGLSKINADELRRGWVRDTDSGPVFRQILCEALRQVCLATTQNKKIYGDTGLRSRKEI